MKPLLIAVVGILLVIRVGSAAELRVLASTRTEEAVEVHSPGGTMLLPARELLVRGEKSGKGMRGNLMVVFDRSSGHFLSCFLTDYFPREFENDEVRLGVHKHSLLASLRSRLMTIYVDRERLVAFRYILASTISMLEATGTASSLDDAENRAVQAATVAMGELDLPLWYGWKPVQLPKALERDFLAQKDSAVYAFAHFKEVARQDDKWHLVLKGSGEGTTKIILNDKREVLEMEWVK